MDQSLRDSGPSSSVHPRCLHSVNLSRLRLLLEEVDPRVRCPHCSRRCALAAAANVPKRQRFCATVATVSASRPQAHRERTDHNFNSFCSWVTARIAPAAVQVLGWWQTRPPAAQEPWELPEKQVAWKSRRRVTWGIRKHSAAKASWHTRTKARTTRVERSTAGSQLCHERDLSHVCQINPVQPRLAAQVIDQSL